MKKIYIFILTICSFSMQSQDWTIGEKSVTGVFTSTKSKSELFTSINKWISINYGSAQSVIQMNDPESGTIIVKGINEVSYTNFGIKVLYPKSKLYSEETSSKFRHTIEINVKENKFRVIYTLTELIPPSQVQTGLEGLLFDLVNLNGDNSEGVKKYNDLADGYLKAGFIGKEKREKHKAAVQEMANDLNTKLIASMKATMLSIENGTIKEDKW
jgi:hypothetical protein